MAFFKNIHFLQKLFLISIIILFYFSNKVKCDDEVGSDTYNKTIGQPCSSNLECNSACCSSDKCSETSKCEKLVTIVYIVEAALCLLFIIGFTIYLIIKLKKIKKDFQKKTSEEEKKQD